MTPEELRTLTLFNTVESSPEINQRQLAQELDVSLGLTNTYFQRVLKKGWVHPAFFENSLEIGVRKTQRDIQLLSQLALINLRAALNSIKKSQCAEFFRSHLYKSLNLSDKLLSLEYVQTLNMIP